MQNDPRDNSLGWGELATAGVTVAITIAAGVLVGWLVDRLLGTLPIFLFLGLLLSVAAAVWYLVLKFRRYLTK